MTWTTRVVTVVVVLLVIVTTVFFAKARIWPFNYYYDYNLLKRSIADAGCTIEHETVNHDLTLEEITFTIRTPSGWKLDMFFPDIRDMDQLCERPEGIMLQTANVDSRFFGVDLLNEILKKRNIEIHNIGDILRNFDRVGPILQKNLRNDEIPRKSQFPNNDFYRYLRVSEPWKPSPSEILSTPALRSTATNERSEQGAHGLPLRRVDFDAITLNSDGSVNRRFSLSTKCYLEDLGSGLNLAMVIVPAGQFLMGTTFEQATLVQAEYVQYCGKDFAEFWHEGPPHTVSVPSFYIGMFEVTQAQWRAVAGLPLVNIELPADPSYFKGDNRPVEEVSWLQAVEFCDRLSAATGRNYRLPTEAEWEYACRAGTTTAYYFGNAITTEYSNYDGIEPYGSVGWGADRDETMPVGALGAPNSFGLYDMHGNVGEMCADPWQETYHGAPGDARVWTNGGDPYIHPVRGGAIISTPAFMRAASRRQDYNPDHPCYRCGFRVVATAGSTR